MSVNFDNIEAARRYVAEDFRRMVEYRTRAEGYTPALFQYGVAHWLQCGEPKWVSQSKCMMGFRYSMKTFMLRCYVLWRWLRVPETQVIMHSSNDDMAMRFGSAILQALRADPLMQHLAPSGQVAEGSFTLAGVRHEIGDSLEVGGLFTSMTGKRADFYCADDPESSVDPHSRRDRILEMLEQAKFILYGPGRVFNRIGQKMPDAENVQLIVAGQPHHERTAYLPDPESDEEKDAHPLADAQFLRIPFLRADGSWTYPDHPKFYDHVKGRTKTTAEVMRGFTKRTWRLEMMCDTTPLSGKLAVLDLSCIEQKYRLLDRACLFIDPADSEAGCATGLAILGIHGNKIHVAYMGEIRGEAYEGEVEDGSIGESIWAHIFGLADEFKVARIYIEKNYKSAAAACRRYQRKANTTIPVEEYHVTGRKLNRITEALEQPINNRMVSANPEVMADRENHRQLSRLTYYKLPEPNDRLDALAKGFSQMIENGELTDPGSDVDEPEYTIPNVRLGAAKTHGSNLTLV